MNCAKAFARAGDHENFIRVMQDHPFLKERDMTLKRALAWRFFDAGRLRDAQIVIFDNMSRCANVTTRWVRIDVVGQPENSKALRY